MISRHALVLLTVFWFVSACSTDPVPSEQINPGTGQITRTGMVAVPGGNIFYEVSNPDAEGTPLLLIHGGPGGTSCGYGLMDNQILDRPVIRYDQLETGRSDRPGLRQQWNIEHSVAEIDAIRRSLNLDELHLMGWSWGGAVAAEYVLKGQQEGIGGMILAGPLLSTPVWIEDANYLLSTMPEELQSTIRLHEAAEDYDHPDYIAATDSFYARFMTPLGRPYVPECEGVSGNNEVYSTMWGPTEFTATGTLLTYDRREQLPDIDVPVLIISGEFDEARPETMETFAGMMPEARVEVVPGAGQGAPLERPELVADLVSSFLSEIENR